MKQPELGQKILALRQEKGLTQEELVEQCNISVRTIQRIEAGEVTPRSYTVRTILSALDYDLEQLKYKEHQATTEFKKLFLLEVDNEKEAGFLNRQLNIAWICGVIYFLIGFLEIPLDLSRWFDDVFTIGKAAYVSVKLVALISYIFFIRGFILTGKIFNNYLLKVSSFILIFISALYYVHDITSLFIDSFSHDFILGATSLTYGIGSIFFGIALFRLQPALGSIALVIAVFELIAAFFFLTIVLGWLGLIINMPTVLLEVVMLYKILGLIKQKEKEITRL